MNNIATVNFTCSSTGNVVEVKVLDWMDDNVGEGIPRTFSSKDQLAIADFWFESIYQKSWEPLIERLRVRSRHEQEAALIGIRFADFGQGCMMEKSTIVDFVINKVRESLGI